jgi:hypothetical protein
MNLREICALKSGDLIYGIHVDLKKRKKYLCKDYWLLTNDISDPGVVINVGETGIDEEKNETVRVVNFFFIPNIFLSDLSNINVITSTSELEPGLSLEEQLKTEFLISNSKQLKSTIVEKITYETITQGSFLGTSLGQTIMVVVPSNSSYRSGYSAVCCLHKMLFMNKVVWACLNVTIPTNYNEKFFSNLPNAKMEI